MKKLFILLLLLLPLYVSPASAQNQNINSIYLHLTSKVVCSTKADKCWPVATGNKTHPTPLGGPFFVLTKYTHGFTWQNPFTKQIFEKNSHPLGPIWIGILTTTQGIHIGFHQTPTPSISLSQQESLGGCVRMSPSDILEFSSFVTYFDPIYILP